MSTSPTDTTVIALVNQALIAARARCRVAEHRRNGSVSSEGHPGITLDVSRRSIARIPQEVIRLIKDEIERSAQLSQKKKRDHGSLQLERKDFLFMEIHCVNYKFAYADSLWPTID